MKHLLIITFLLLWVNSFACSCIGQSTVKSELKRSDVVITGTVINKSEFFVMDSLTKIKISRARYIVAIKSIYKGRLRKPVIEIISGVGGGDCGFDFKVGSDYIIYAKYQARYYAQGPTVKKFLHTDICWRTRMKNISEIAELTKYRKPHFIKN
jgi:hypothetical protein